MRLGKNQKAIVDYIIKCGGTENSVQVYLKCGKAMDINVYTKSRDALVERGVIVWVDETDGWSHDLHIPPQVIAKLKCDGVL